MNISDSDFKKILTDYKKICVIGLSADADKPAHSVPLYMRSKSYEIIGVHPRGRDIDGIKVYPDLQSVPAEDRKFINVFRKPEAIPEVVDEILKLGGTEVLWLQLGISHAEAEKKAEVAGLKVISNRCLYIEHRKWMV